MNRQQIVLATGNRGKLDEMQTLLEELGLELIPQSALNIPDAIEDGLGFVENALIKARHASRLSGLPAIADDSGLAVDALQGAPGIHSSRYAGENAGSEENIDKLLTALADVPAPGRTARFHCLMVFVRHADDPTPLICQGCWEGRISQQRRGDHGFGYDPVFLLADRDITSAELDSEEKNRLSHRGQALRQLRQQLPIALR